MYVGEEFNTYDEFETRVASLCQHHTSSSTDSGGRGKRVRVRCSRAGSVCVNVITRRELCHHQRTVTSQCQFKIILTTKEDGKCVVIGANLEHDHDICQEIYFQFPNIRYLHKNSSHYGLTRGQLGEVVEWLDNSGSKHPRLQRVYRLLKMARYQTLGDH
ncbi:uncharacterized protein LOC117332584 [Pecten maximus]|uniref:uncharacterized protein LOC117332584 n=1 Tax=Pecten maximus TaxID=6579 RepID=UPI001457EAF4|nr:uncharacterized protein LOC117332584 [Pecten maximus]